MRRHPSRDAELEAIIKDYDLYDATVDLEVTVGDLDVSKKVESFDLSWASGNATWELNLTLALLLGRCGGIGLAFLFENLSNEAST